MNLDIRAFPFIISLAAVINGLGIVRLLSTFAELLRKRHTLKMQNYSVYNAQALFQFVVHILLWWSMWGLHDATNFDFVRYAYLLLGPILLYLGTSVMTPDVEGDIVDVRAVYWEMRSLYFSILALVWVWAAFVWPVFEGAVAPTLPVVLVLLGIAVVLRVSDSPKLHALLVPANLIVVVFHVLVYAMELGGVSAMLE